jgi:hypothetical protein
MAFAVATPRLAAVAEDSPQLLCPFSRLELLAAYCLSLAFSHFGPRKLFLVTHSSAGAFWSFSAQKSWRWSAAQGLRRAGRSAP